MKVTLKERRFKSRPHVSIGLFEAIESSGVSDAVLPAPRFVNMSRVSALSSAGVEIEFANNENT
jgi:hypothetical protein